MLLRISLIFAILAGAGVIVVTQLKLREHVTGIIAVREQNKSWLATEKAEHTKTKGDLTDTKDKLAKTTTDLANTQTELASTTTKLADAEAAKIAITKNLEKAQEEKKTAQLDLAKWEVLGVSPEQVKKAIADLKKAYDSIGIMEEEKKVVMRKVRSLENQLALLVGTNEDYEVPLPVGLKGLVKVVDPKWDFVVLDIGEKQGVLQHGKMMVHRDSKLVGKVKILNVMPDRCIANVLPGWKLSDIQEGDQVLY